MPKNVAGFAAAYTLLALVTIGAGLGAYAEYQMPSKASARVSRFHAREIQAIRRNQGDTNLTRLADKYIGDQAASHGYAISKIQIVRIVQKGSEARVYANVTLTDGVNVATQQLVVVFRRNLWQAQVIEAG